jgi:hypothetical protein
VKIDSVTGLSFLNTFIGLATEIIDVDPINIDSRIPYLQTHLRDMFDSTDDTANYDIYWFEWTGNAPAETDDVLEDTGDDSLRQYLREKRTEADEKNKPLIVVSHSWGTFLSYIALALEGAEADPLEADLLITMGSPLGSEHAHAGLYPEELVIKTFVDLIISEIGFDTDLSPKVPAIYNFWAWGDMISGPIDLFVPSSPPVYDIRIDEGMFDLPDDQFTGSTDFAWDNRQIDEMFYWHYFDAIYPEVLTSEHQSYLDRVYIKDEANQFNWYLDRLENLLRTTGGEDVAPDREITVSIDKIHVVNENEGDGLFNFADDQAEYFGWFHIYVNGQKRAIRRMRAPLDNADLEEGDDYYLNWECTLGISSSASSVKVEAELYEYDGVLYDPYDDRGIESETVYLSAGLPQSGDFNVAWEDASGGDNEIKVYYSVR